MNNIVAQSIEKLLTVQDVMDTLRISRPTLYRMLKAGQLQPVRIGKRTLFDPMDIRELIEEAKTGAKPLPSQKGKKLDRNRKRAVAASRKRRTPRSKEDAPEMPKAAGKKPEDDTGKQGRLL